MSKIVTLKKEKNLKKPEEMLENLTLPNISGYIKFDNTLHFGTIERKKYGRRRKNQRRTGYFERR